MSQANSHRLSLGILGAGAAAQWYYMPAAKAWSGSIDLNAICDLDPERARHFASMYDVSNVYGDYEEMLSNTDIDAVAVLTPHDLHAEQVLKALEHGKHVLVEKPMASTLADAQKICDLADTKGLYVSCAPPNMLHPGSGIFLPEEQEAGCCGTMPACYMPDVFRKTWDLLKANTPEAALAYFTPFSRLAAYEKEVCNRCVWKELLVRRGIIASGTVRDPKPAFADDWQIAQLVRVAEQAGLLT